MPTESRREFLQLGLAIGAAMALPACATGLIRSAPDREYLRLPAAAERGSVGLAITPSKRWRSACKQALAQVSDLAWLKRGDSVFLKVVSNSGNAHPAVTAPEAVEVMVALLRGAGAETHSMR